MKTFHKIYPIAFILLFSVFLFYSCDNQISSYKFGNGTLTGTYPTESLPGDSALLFAPGIVSTGLYERDMAVSPMPDACRLLFHPTENTCFLLLHTVKKVTARN